MKQLRVEYVGAQQVFPERYTALVLATADREQIIPIWVTPAKGEYCTSLDLDNPDTRPTIYTLFGEIIQHYGDTLDKIHMHGYSEGVFYTSLVLGNEEEIELLPSDAVMMALVHELPIEVDEDVFESCAVYIGDEEGTLDEIFSGHMNPEDRRRLLASDAVIDHSVDDVDFVDLLDSMGYHPPDFTPPYEDPNRHKTNRRKRIKGPHKPNREK